MKIYVGVVDNKHGTAVYVGADQVSLKAQIAGWCRQQWKERGPGGPSEIAPPAGMADDEIIGSYFRHQRETGDEWHLISEMEMVLEAPTAGPWHVENDVVLDADRGKICIVADRASYKEHVANARLLAASPQLEAALRGLVEWCRAHTSPRDINSPHGMLTAAVALLNSLEAR